MAILVHWLQALAINALLIACASRVPLLTAAGWVHAAALGTILWGTLGPPGWLAVVAYLLLGSLVTRLGFGHKQARGLAESRNGRRGPENVWGSAATGTLLALLSAVVADAWRPLLLLGFVASFAAKLADTFGSEIGKRWGRRTLLITTLRPVPPGTEGAISLEGTAASLVGGIAMALICAGLGLLQGAGPQLLLLALVSAVALIATLIESAIGATLQQRWSWLSNELVNALQTAIAALLAMALAMALAVAVAGTAAGFP